MKKNYVLIAATIAVLLLTTLACRVSFNEIGLRGVSGSGEVVVVDRPVSSFDSIDFSGVGQMIIEIGEEESLRIEAEDNIIKYIETEVRGDTLTIGMRPRINLRPTEPIIYYATVVSLEEISVSGAGNVDAPGLAAARFRVHISGAGDVDIDGLEADELDVTISGLGNLSIFDGQVNTQDVDISGSGSHEARQLTSAYADISLSGLGSAAVWVTERLDVDISGAGSVRYAGDPSVSSNVSGLGSIKQIEE